MTTAHLEAEILKMPRSVRIRLTERLISSLDEGNVIERNVSIKMGHFF